MKPYVLSRYALLWLMTVFIAVPSLSLGGEEKKAPESVTHESSLYYTVKKGDTLWDLSQRFADTPWQWPDLWNKNGQITNPHRIFPGEKILLYRNKGTENPAPLKIYKKPVPAPVIATAPLQPPPPPPPYYMYTSIDQVGFLRKAALNPIGRIFSVQGNKKMISSGDTIYVKGVAGKTLLPGQRYTVYRLRAPVSDKKVAAVMGVQHYILGIIEIREKMPDFAIAEVLRSFRVLRANDLMVPYTPRSPKIIIAPSKEGLTGNILISEEHQSFFGTHTIAFINKGDKNGVRIGQKYNVFYEEKISGSAKEKTLLSHPVDYATFLVLHTEADTAAVLVVAAEKSIPPGARFRSPQ
jgi:hypothetical protein